jgi:DNA topoisomerase-3
VEFSARYQAWEGCEPGELFAADVVKRADGRMVGHLEREARGCDYLVLFLDCDREGENICFEVMEACAGGLKTGATEPGAPSARILRAKFSAVTRESIERAMRTLGEPNRNEALAVDARQELDLKMGVAFTRFQTQYFLNKYDRLDARVVSYGPCQTPTLGFAVQRHLEIIRHVPEPYWALDASFDDAATGDTIAPAWRRTRLFDEETTRAFLQLVNDANEFRVTSIEPERAKHGRDAQGGVGGFGHGRPPCDASRRASVHGWSYIVPTHRKHGVPSRFRVEADADDSKVPSDVGRVRLALARRKFDDVAQARRGRG